MVEQIRWGQDNPHTFFKNEDGIGLGREIREVKAIKNVGFSWLRRIRLYDMTNSLEEIQKKFIAASSVAWGLIVMRIKNP